MSYSQTHLARAYSPLSQSIKALCIIHTVSCPLEWHYIIYLYSPSFHHICLRTSHLTIHIILVNSHIHKHVLSLQELKVRLPPRQSCLPSLARVVRTGESISEPRLPSPWRITRMSEPISGLILVRMSTVLLLQWHPCRISRRPQFTQVTQY